MLQWLWDLFWVSYPQWFFIIDIRHFWFPPFCIWKIAVAVLMPVFLPDESATVGQICAKLKGNISTEDLDKEDMAGKFIPTWTNHVVSPFFAPHPKKKAGTLDIEYWPVLTLPCLIFGSWLLLAGLGFVYLALVAGLQLPTFHCSKLELASVDKSPEIKSDQVLVQQEALIAKSKF